MEAFRVHEKKMKTDYGICQQKPYFETLEKMQRISYNTELFRCAFSPFLELTTPMY